MVLSSFFKFEDTLADVDPKKTRVLWKGLFSKNKAFKRLTKEKTNFGVKQQGNETEAENTFYKSKSSRKAQKEAEDAAEALRRLQEAEQEAEILQKRV